MLDLINLNKTFNDVGSFEVLKNINLSAKEGEFVCVVGPSGCGKTILLYLIAGFLEKTSGQILVENKPVNKPGIDKMMVFQDYVLFPWKTVYKNILFGLDKINMSNKEKEKLVKKYLDLVDLTQFKDWHIHKLSGGMQQRVAIARALIVNPKILLMDEPFSALDSQYRKFFRKNLLEIWQKTKKTIIFVTHSITEAIYLADKIYLLSSRPATIKKEYKVNLPRPRNLLNLNFINLKREIEIETTKEFEKIIQSQTITDPLEHLLNIKL
ncbi:MAG: ABC transporter ATP-binding protein [Patescibacteria group bacterium]